MLKKKIVYKKENKIKNTCDQTSRKGEHEICIRTYIVNNLHKYEVIL
jgi:hypothetical protein